MSASPEHFQPTPRHPLPQKLTPDEVIARVKAMARRQELSAQAAVEAGYRTEPDPDRLRDVEVLDAVGILLEFLLPDWEDVRTMIRKKRWANR